MRYPDIDTPWTPAMCERAAQAVEGDEPDMAHWMRTGEVPPSMAARMAAGEREAAERRDRANAAGRAAYDAAIEAAPGQFSRACAARDAAREAVHRAAVWRA